MRKFSAVWLSISFGFFWGVNSAAHATSSVQLNWTIPATRENGQVLAASDLSGYELYYTTDDPSVTGTIKISGGSTSSYTAQNLAAGTYHFAISAVDISGLKSKLSTVAGITLTESLVAPTVISNMALAVLSTSTATSKSIKVSWMPPKTREDGTPLSVSELSGYKINLYSPGGIVNASVSGGGVTSYVIPDVGAGWNVIELIAIDSAGKQSRSISQSVRVR